MTSLLTLAHSPDPDDVFMWWPITGMIDPRDHARIIQPPVLDTGRFSFRALPADIDVLNRRAIEKGDLDITALSIFAWSKVRDRYALTCCGSSFGEGYGPKLVMRSSPPAGGAGESHWPGTSVPGKRATSSKPAERATEASAAPQRRIPPENSKESQPLSPAPRASELSGTAPDAYASGQSLSPTPSALPPNPLIAIPGTRTTAFLLLSLALKQTSFRILELPFDQILDAVASKHADAGLLIHQSQLTYADLGLIELLDLGAWWLEHAGLPLPLGGNALNRNLETRFGPGTLREVTTILDRSIRHALAHRDESTRYAMQFAPEISREQADRYIDMYVSDLTLDAGPRGQRAINRLLAEAAAAGICPQIGDVEMIRPV